MIFSNFINKLKTSRRFLIITIIAVLIVIFFVYKNINQNERDKFILEKVSVGTVLREVSEAGTVKASEEIELGFKTAGKIEKIYVKVGDTVKTGQNLAKLDFSDLVIKLEKAKAALKVIEAKKTDAKVLLENYRQNLKDTETDGKKDLESAYEDALNDLDDAYLKMFNAFAEVDSLYRKYFTLNNQQGIRVKENKDAIGKAIDSAKTYIDSAKKNNNEDDIDKALVETKNSLSLVKNSLVEIRNQTETIEYKDKVSNSDKTSLDNHKSYINTAYTNIVNTQQDIAVVKITNETNINSTRGKVTEMENQLKETDDGLYSAQLKEAQKDITLLENQIGDTFLRSPIEGKITEVKKEIGETIQTNEVAIIMLSSTPFQIKADIYEGDIVGIEIGNSVKINLVAFPDETLTGKVVSINPAEKLIDDIVYYEITIAFDQPKQDIRNGMTSDIIIETAKKENVLRLPKRAVEKINGERMVEIFNNGKIEKKEIKTGVEGNDYVEVLEGLKDGEEVAAGKKI